MKISRNLWLVSLTSLLNDISSEMVYPLIGFFVTGTLGAPAGLVGVIEGIAESLASFLKLASGWWSDRVRHRRNFAVAGYAISIAGKCLLAFASAWGAVLAGRGLDKVGKGVRTAPRDALIAEEADPAHHGRAFGFHRAMDTAGAALGVVIAYGALERFGGSGDLVPTLLKISIVPAVLGVLVLMLVKERRREPVAPAARPASLHPLRAWRALPSRLRGFLGVWFVFNLGASSDVMLFLTAHRAGATIPQVVLMYLVFNVFAAGLSHWAGRRSDRIGRKGTLVWSCAMYGVLYAGFAYVAWHGEPEQPGRWVGVLFVLFALYGVQRALSEGVAKALVADLAPGEAKATVLGLHELLVGVGVLCAGVIAGAMWEASGPAVALGFGGACGVVGAVGLMFTLRPGPPGTGAAR